MVGLSDEEAAIVALVREFTDREVRPVVRDLEHDNAYPAKLIEQMKQLGGAPVPSHSRTAAAGCGR
ncbi:MAG TPA: acyl-CoA dehydrogenase family protein [Trebonia sp.]|nr:acyl-CoA dehydrogenase family protein [Trebonia sp.]